MAVEVVMSRAKVRRAARGVFMVGFDGGVFLLDNNNGVVMCYSSRQGGLIYLYIPRIFTSSASSPRGVM